MLFPDEFFFLKNNAYIAFKKKLKNLKPYQKPTPVYWHKSAKAFKII